MSCLPFKGQGFLRLYKPDIDPADVSGPSGPRMQVGLG